MTKINVVNQIDMLIQQLHDERNSVFVLQPLVEDVYKYITRNKNFRIVEHLSIDLDDGEQNARREEMEQLLEGLKEQLDLFWIDNDNDDEAPRREIGFR